MRARSWRPRSWIAYGGAILAVEALGALTGSVTASAVDGWYRQLAKPPLVPPDWAFPVVWPVLYAMIAVAGVMIWRSEQPGRGRALAVYLLQLALNYGWTLVFVGAQLIGFAALWIMALLGSIVWTIVLFARISRLAAWLLVPYAAWVAFATYLNLGIWWLNG